jgi:hypothetical protein
MQTTALEHLQANVQGMDLEMDPATYYNSAPNFNADVLREEEDAQYLEKELMHMMM